MNPLLGAVLLLCLYASVAQAGTSVKVEMECTVSGLRITGEKAPKPFIEQFRAEQSEEEAPSKTGKPEKWAVAKAELISDGKKLDPSLIEITAEHAVLAYAHSIGGGYNRRLLVFTYVVDVNGRELTRIVSSVPEGLEERTRNPCKPK